MSAAPSARPPYQDKAIGSWLVGKRRRRFRWVGKVFPDGSTAPSARPPYQIKVITPCLAGRILCAGDFLEGH